MRHILSPRRRRYLRCCSVRHRNIDANRELCNVLPLDSPETGLADFPASLRSACAEIASRARFVSIDLGRLEPYAAELAVEIPRTRSAPDAAPDQGWRSTAAFWLTLDAINFGSGWFPTLRKRPGATGYRTIEAGVCARFDRVGPWDPDQLSAIAPAELAALMDQDPEHELIALFTASLRDLGDRITRHFGGSFAAAVQSADGSAVSFVRMLAGWTCFADTSTYAGMPVPFLKRAQIAAADLHRSGAAAFTDLEQLTMFADNLVPHVLRLDGVLRFDPELVARIERGALIEHGSPAEIEIRACALHAVELLVGAVPAATTAAELDSLLWHRGQGDRYKSSPRHRSRSTAY